MRRALLLSGLLAGFVAVGCGKSSTQPANVTAEEERKLKEDQKAVEDEEKQHMKANRNLPTADTQKAESEERAHQRGR